MPCLSKAACLARADVENGEANVLLLDRQGRLRYRLFAGCLADSARRAARKRGGYRKVRRAVDIVAGFRGVARGLVIVYLSDKRDIAWGSEDTRIEKSDRGMVVRYDSCDG